MQLTVTNPNVIEGLTIHPSTIKNPSDVRIFRPAGDNTKLGGCTDYTGKYKKLNKKEKQSIITARKWIGQKFYSTTLTERETCPTDCLMWRKCYGNSMGFAHRIEHGAELLESMMWEIQTLTVENRMRPFVVRPHVLGDFYSLEYVEQWAKALDQFPINVFGYTAYLPTSTTKEYAEIGQALIELREKYSDRFWIRQSGSNAEEMSAIGISHHSAEDQIKNNQAFICPQQTKKSKRFWMGEYQPKKVKNCASCGLCYATKKNVIFLEH